MPIFSSINASLTWQYWNSALQNNEITLPTDWKELYVIVGTDNTFEGGSSYYAYIPKLYITNNQHLVLNMQGLAAYNAGASGILSSNAQIEILNNKIHITRMYNSKSNGNQDILSYAHLWVYYKN